MQTKRTKKRNKQIRCPYCGAVAVVRQASEMRSVRMDALAFANIKIYGHLLVALTTK